MPKKTFIKILPKHEKIKKNKFLKIFGKLLYKKELWSINRKSILTGVFIGVFVCFIPMPFQMVLVALFCIIFNANFSIAFLLIWISNPLTMPFIYYLEYELGNLILNKSNTLEFSFETMNDNLNEIALSLYTGTIIISTTFAFLSVFLLNLFWIKKVRKRRKKK